MSNKDQNYFSNFHKMTKATTEKDFKTAMDKHWLTFHAEISRMNPEFKKTKKADFITFTRIARAMSFEDFFKYAQQELEVPPVKLKPDEMKSMRAALGLFAQLIPVMDSQFGADWFMKQKDAAPVVAAPVAAEPAAAQKKAA